jgi:hypothetical protein
MNSDVVSGKGFYSEGIRMASARQHPGHVLTNTPCSFCGQPMVRRPWNDEKDMLQCDNFNCPRDHQKQGTVAR